MTRRKTLVFASAVLLFLAACVSVSAKNDWELLGERTVSHKADRDEIMVTAAEGRFDRIKLTVKRAMIEFMDVKVHYANGDVEDIKVRGVIKAGGETRVIDLEGKERIIRKVVFHYKTIKRRGNRAVVALWGRH